MIARFLSAHRHAVAEARATAAFEAYAEEKLRLDRMSATVPNYSAVLKMQEARTERAYARFTSAYADLEKHPVAANG